MNEKQKKLHRIAEQIRDARVTVATLTEEEQREPLLARVANGLIDAEFRAILSYFEENP